MTKRNRSDASAGGLRKGDRVRPTPEAIAKFSDLRSTTRGTVEGRTRHIRADQVRVRLDREPTPSTWDERWWASTNRTGKPVAPDTVTVSEVEAHLGTKPVPAAWPLRRR